MQHAQQDSAQLQSITAENELIIAQLHQIQEELENYYLDNKQKLVTIEHLQQNLAQKETELNNQSTQLKQSQHELEQLKHSQQKNEADIQALTSENELILEQLHQAQEELEHYYLANRHLQEHLSNTQQTLSSASSVVLRLNKALEQYKLQNTQQSSKIELDTQKINQLSVELKQYQQAHTNMDDQLKASHQTLTQATTTIIKLRNQVEQKQSHIEQLEQEVHKNHQSISELEQYRQTNNFMLEQLKDSQQTFNQARLVITQLQQERASSQNNQQEIKQQLEILDKKHSVLQQEKQQLLQQVEQLNAKIQQYDQFNQFIQTHLGSSQQTLNRARHVISRLVTQNH